MSKDGQPYAEPATATPRADRGESADGTQRFTPGGAWVGALLGTRPVRVPLLTLLGLLLVVRAVNFAVGVSGFAWGYDFSAYWLAGRHVLEGLPLYSAAQLGGAYPPQEQFLYLYPPFFAVVMAPFAALFGDYRVAMFAWALIGLVVVAASVAGIARAAGMPARTTVFLVLAALALPPVGFELVMGNVNALLLALLGLAWLGLDARTRRGELVAGAMVGIAALIKVFPIVIVLWFLATGRYRAAAAALITPALLAGATIPVVGLSPWLEFPRVLANIGPPQDLYTSLAPTSVTAALVDFGVAKVLVAAIGVLLLVWSARVQQPAISYSVAVMVSVLAVPTIYPHSLTLAILPLLLLTLSSRSGVAPSVAYGALLVGGQAAIIGLQVAALRALALVGTVAPLAALIRNYRIERKDAG